MLDVCDTLCFALLGMALSAFCIAQVLSMLILRRRFLKRPSLAPVQSLIEGRLKIVLGLFAALWLYYFGAGVDGVVKAVMSENFIPVPFLFFSPILSGLFTLTLLGKSLRAREQEMADLALEVQGLREIQIASGNWSDEWRAREVEAMKLPHAVSAERVKEWRQSWSTRGYLNFRKKAFRAFVMLGESSYREVLAMFHNENMENIKRRSLVTGMPIPK